MRWPARFIPWTLAAVGCVAAAPASAQPAAELPRAIRLISTLCPGHVAKMVQRRELAMALQARPIDIPRVCGCSAEVMAADRNLVRHLDVDVPTQMERMRVDRTKSYVTARLLQSVFVCLAPELDASLAAQALEP